MSQTFHDRAGLAGAAPSLVHRLLRPLAHGMQQLPFAGKAWLISLCFLLPLGLLYGAYWQQTWQAMGGLRQEQAGLRMLREMEPWLVEAQRQRRRQMAGEQERLDWPALDAHARQWRAQAHSGRWPALAMAWEGVEAAHKTLAAQQHRPLDSTQVDALEGYVKAIRAIGAEHAILSSDLGQKVNPVHTEGWKQILQIMAKAGLSKAELDMISKTNPAKLLGLQ